MALFSGKITDSLVKSSRRFIKFVGMGRDDVKQHRAIAQWGDESVPIEGSVAIYGHTSVNGESVVIGYINKVATSDLKPGEKRLFSTDSDGVEQIYIRLTDDGKIELAGQDDNLVRYLELKTAFDELKTDFNNLVTRFNIHTHSGVTVGPGVTGVTTVTANQSTADMSAAKIDELQCSG